MYVRNQYLLDKISVTDDYKNKELLQKVNVVNIITDV